MKKGIISLLSMFAGVIAGAGIAGKMAGEAIDKEKNMSDKHLALFLMMNRWVKVKQEGRTLASYFNAHGYKKIAIYGMSHVGETLVGELAGSEVQVAYGIDKNANGVYSDIEVVSMEDCPGEVDAIVVTPITFFDEIEQELCAKVNCPVISLEDILYEVQA